MTTEQRKIGFVVQAGPNALYDEVRRNCEKAIEVAKKQYRDQYGDDQLEVVLLQDPTGAGPRGYVTPGILYAQLRKAEK